MMSAVLLPRVRVYGPEQLRGLRFARLARGVLWIDALWMRALPWARKLFGSRLTKFIEDPLTLRRCLAKPAWRML